MPRLAVDFESESWLKAAKLLIFMWNCRFGGRRYSAGWRVTA
ncbi:hypothetical protein F444_21531 [Phytophthora nicotianae P1976]|uniref:Uncharacterized protein n=1 Tax=Phytophthora nicotianae P1976 TaxID=1317066 RepID=A0A080Z0T6_PHYNI|nr:hypothetical protein F444_21531 [Phytophthora nicotianae P1976]